MPIFPVRLSTFKARRRRRATANAVPAILETLEGRRLLTAPGMIEGVAAFQDGPPRLAVTWQADINAARYEVEFTGDPIRFELTRSTNLESLTLDMTSFGQDSLRQNSYDIRVRGESSEGEFGEWSDTINFIFEGLPAEPGPPVFSEFTLSRHNNYFEETPQQSMGWFWNGTTPQFDVWINKIEAAGPSIYVRDSVAGSSFRADEPFEAGVYKFWARAKHPERVDKYVSEWVGPLTTVIGSAQPELSGPTTSQSSRPEITWEGGAADIPFELWVNVEGGASKVIFESGIAGNTFTPSSDLADGIYNAWVRQTPTTSNALPWSSRFRFVVGGAGIPATAELQVSGTAGNVTFQWSAAANSIHYDLYVTDIRIGSRGFGSETITDLDYVETTIVDTDQVYRAWLRGHNADGIAGSWSSAVTFRFNSSGEVIL